MPLNIIFSVVSPILSGYILHRILPMCGAMGWHQDISSTILSVFIVTVICKDMSRSTKELAAAYSKI